MPGVVPVSVPFVVSRLSSSFLFVRWLLPGLLGLCLTGAALAEPGNLVSWTSTGQNELTFTCQNAVIRLQMLDANVARVTQTGLTGTFSTAPSFTVIKTWPLPPMTVTDGVSAITVATSGLRIDISKTPFRVAYRRTDGTLLLSDTNTFGLGLGTNAASANFNMPAGEQYYGGGLIEGYPFSYRGQQRTLNNAYTPFQGGYTPNLPVPLVVSSKGYGVFFDNTFSQSWDFNNTSGTQWLVVVNGGEMNYYFIAGTNSADVLDSYTQMTGRAPLPPRWTCGFIQSKYGYHNWGEVFAADSALRANDLPCDALVLDYFWFGSPSRMGNLAWDTTNFPSPSTNIANLGTDGFKVMAIHEPYIVSSTTSFSDGAALKYLMADHPDGTQPSTVNGWYGNAAYVDFNNPAAGAWWFGKLQNIINDGIAAHWTDLGEPEEDDATDYSYDGRRELELHNVYSLLWHRDLAAGYAANYPNQRYFFFSRAGFAGDQRYGTGHWTSDAAANFETLTAHENAICNYGLSGLSLFGTDIGGYSGYPSDELYVRWFQFGAFCPVFRAHGDVNDYPGKHVAPYEFSSLVEDYCRTMLKLRYRLMPYIYTAERATHDTGLPVCRAMPLAFPNDSSVLQDGTQFMFGPSMLVAPITTQGVTARNVYFPAGRWIDHWTGQVITGPASLTRPGPESQIPLFYADNSIIPLGPYVASTQFDDGSQRALRINCSSNASYLLYDDDGATNGYLTNQFATTAISATRPGSALTVQIGGAVGSYLNQPGQRTWGLEIFGSNAVRSVVADGAILGGVDSAATLAGANSGYYLDGAQNLLRIKLPTAAMTAAHNVTAYYDLQAPAPFEARIDGGGHPYLDRSGVIWTEDRPYAAGSFGFDGGNTATIANPIQGTNDPLLFQGEHFGQNFTCKFDCPNGLYQIQMLDAETYWTAAGQRKFNLFINGTQVLSNFDIFAAAGGQNIAITRTFTAAVTTGQIVMQFQGVATGSDVNARVSGIRVVKVADPDTDNDGIPDWWTQVYFGHPTGQTQDLSLAGQDADGTGMTNLQKYRAGLNPRDPSSRLAVQSVTSQSANNQTSVTLAWQSQPGIVYRVQWKNSLTDSNWTSLGPDIVGDGSVLRWTDDGSLTATLPAAARFYRIAVP